MAQFYPPVPIDTGWQVLSLDAAASVSGGLTPMISRVGNEVKVIGRVTQSGSIIATLPADWLPPQILRFIGNTGSSGSGVAPVVVDPSTGTLFTSAGATVNLCQSWFVA